jgi:hypothetical protein
MAQITRTVINSLDVGMARQLAQITDTSGIGGVYEIEINSRADRLALFLSVVAITGTMTVEVFTKENLQSNITEMPVTSFPTQTSPTTQYLRIVTPIIVSPYIVRITYSASVQTALYAKAVNSIEADDILEVSIGDKSTSSLISQVLTTPNTWYTITLPAGTRDFEIQSDPPARLDIRFSAGDAPEFWPIPAGNTFTEQFLASSALTSVQVRCPGSSPTARVKVWKSN